MYYNLDTMYSLYCYVVDSEEEGEDNRMGFRHYSHTLPHAAAAAAAALRRGLGHFRVNSVAAPRQTM